MHVLTDSIPIRTVHGTSFPIVGIARMQQREPDNANLPDRPQLSAGDRVAAGDCEEAVKRPDAVMQNREAG